MTVEEQEKLCNEKFKAIFKSIKKIDELVDCIHKLTISVSEIANSLKFIEAETTANKKNIEELKHDKINKYDSLMKIVTTAVISVIIGYIAKGVGLWFLI